MQYLVDHKGSKAVGGLVLDGDTLLRALRLPCDTITYLREMQVGDSYAFFDFCGSAIINDDSFDLPSATAGIERQSKGLLILNALWFMLPMSSKERVTVFVPAIEMRLLPNRKFLILSSCCGGDADEQLASIWSVVRMFRFAHRLSWIANAQGYSGDAKFLLPHIPKPEQQCGQRVVFLDTLVTKMLVGQALSRTFDA